MNGWYVEKESLPEGILEFSESLCGCGSPVDCWRVLHEYLKKCNSDDFYQNTDDPFKLFFMYIISDFGLTEHGTSIYGSWPTKKGREALEWLNHNIQKVDDMIITYGE